MLTIFHLHLCEYIVHVSGFTQTHGAGSWSTKRIGSTMAVLFYELRGLPVLPVYLEYLRTFDINASYYSGNPSKRAAPRRRTRNRREGREGVTGETRYEHEGRRGINH